MGGEGKGMGPGYVVSRRPGNSARAQGMEEAVAMGSGGGRAATTGQGDVGHLRVQGRGV